MATKKKKDDSKRKLVNQVTWNTSIEVPVKEPNFHSLRLRGKEVDLSCSTKDRWITLYPITDITKDISFCPACGQQLVSEVLFDKLNGLMPNQKPLQGKE
jgi:hypothetical protein